MLLLMRRIDEVINIKDKNTGQEIDIMVTKISDGQVTFGIKADRNYDIYRTEIECHNCKQPVYSCGCPK